MSNKLPKGPGVDWSKRTARQYAYRKTMGIHVDVIAKIEQERSEHWDKLKKQHLKEGFGILEYIEFEDKYKDTITPVFPKVPNDKLIEFHWYLVEHNSFFVTPILWPTTVEVESVKGGVYDLFNSKVNYKKNKTMQKEKVNKDNFHIATRSNWKHRPNIQLPDRKPDYVSIANRIVNQKDILFITNGKVATVASPDNKSLQHLPIVTMWIDRREGHEIAFLLQTDRVSSEYWYTPAGVYRRSDHWGRCRDCEWNLADDPEEELEFNTPRVGFCAWEDFEIIEK